MFYTAYFKQGAPAASRPITFLFNGGPGLIEHLAAHGRVRAGARGHRRRAAPHAPRALFDRQQRARACSTPSDLVFIDAPGTGFSRIAGKDKEKAFYGVDQDIDAFTEFITQFLTKYDRWNSPKYVFGESYGTMRGAGLALVASERGRRFERRDPAVGHLELGLHARRPAAQPGHRHALRRRASDLCGDRLVFQQGAEQAGGPAAPSSARSKPSRPANMRRRLLKGNDLPEAERQRIAQQLAAYTGLSVPYLLKTNLRIEYGAFQKELMGDEALTTGTLDTRFVGATLDPLSKVASYDPQGSAIGAAYVAAWHGYVRDRLHYGRNSSSSRASRSIPSGTTSISRRAPTSR